MAGAEVLFHAACQSCQSEALPRLQSQFLKKKFISSDWKIAYDLQSQVQRMSRTWIIDTQSV